MADRGDMRVSTLPAYLEVTARSFYLYEYVEDDPARWQRCEWLVCAMEAVLDRHLGGLPQRDALIAAVAVGLEYDSVFRAYIMDFQGATELLKDETWAQINTAAAALMVDKAMRELDRGNA